MMLRVEDGILLKSYSLAWHKDGYSAPPKGWTPDDIADIEDLARKIMADAESIDEDAWNKARVDAWLVIERKHYDNKQPWAGWAPIVYQVDPRIGRAYRELFVELNGGQCPPKFDDRAIHPEDGLYEFRNSKMHFRGEE